MWTLETLANYLKECSHFDLWTDHNPLAQAMNKDILTLTERLQKFQKALQAFNVTNSQIKKIHNGISDALSRVPVGGPKGIERVVNSLRGHASHAYNRIVSSERGDFSPEVIEDPVLDELWDSSGADQEYQATANMVVDKVKRSTVMSKHPVMEYKRVIERLSVIKKKGTMLMVIDYTRIIVPEKMR